MMRKTRWAVLLAAALLLTLAAVPALAAYVYKANGHEIGVYSTASTQNLIGKLASGTNVTVYGRKGSFTEIKYKSGRAYVKTEHIRGDSGSGSRQSSSTSDSTTGDDILAAMNAEFRSMRQTNAYSITVQPSKPSGYVNFRYGPSTYTEVIDRLYMGYTLEVIAAGRSWLQARDPYTGRVGYIYTRYTATVK